MWKYFEILHLCESLSKFLLASTYPSLGAHWGGRMDDSSSRTDYLRTGKLGQKLRYTNFLAINLAKVFWDLNGIFFKSKTYIYIIGIGWELRGLWNARKFAQFSGNSEPYILFIFYRTPKSELYDPWILKQFLIQNFLPFRAKNFLSKMAPEIYFYKA